MNKSFSLNDVSKIKINIFDFIGILSYGELLSDNKYTTKKMRQYFISKFYMRIKN